MRAAIADLVRQRRAVEQLVEPVGGAQLPMRHGRFRATAYRSRLDGTEHLALVMGDLAPRHSGPRGRPGPCAQRVPDRGRRRVAAMRLRQPVRRRYACHRLRGFRRAGVPTGHEGRGIGLGHKLRAYELQERGLDTVAANTALGLPVDSRDYGVGAQILGHLGVRRIRLITNPVKYHGLSGHDLEIIERVAQPVVAGPENVAYLRTKRDRMGHLLDLSAGA